MLKWLTQLKVIVPVLLSAALLAFLFSISDVPGVAAHIKRIPLLAMVLVLALALVYLGFKLVLWHSFMNALEIPTTWRQIVLAFAVGEMTLSLPAGIFAENYVLRRIAGAEFSRSSAATSAVLVVEGAVTLIALVVIGVPGWYWLRPTILSVFAFAALLIVLMLAFRRFRAWTRRVLQMGPLRTVGPEFLDMVDGLGSLFTRKLLALAIPLTAAYLFGLVAAFYLVTLGVGITGFSLYEATSIYLFALGVVLISPISSHLGIIEASGVGAMEAWGYNSSQAFAALLGFRLVWTGAVWLVCGPIVWLFRKEFETEKPVQQRAEPSGAGDDLKELPDALRRGM